MKRSGLVLNGVAVVALVGGVYCLYRALGPIVSMYADALADPMGNAGGDEQVNAIQHDAWVWGPIGVMLFLVATVLSWFATMRWLRRLLGRTDAAKP